MYIKNCQKWSKSENLKKSEKFEEKKFRRGKRIVKKKLSSEFFNIRRTEEEGQTEISVSNIG